MAKLPEGYAQQIAKAQDIEGREKARDGNYVFLIRKISYENTKKGWALIFAHRVVEGIKTNQLVEPNTVGSNVSYFCPDYGEAKVMLMPNAKTYICKLLGINPKTTPDEVLAKSVEDMTSDSQPARGMYIRGISYHTNKKSNGEDFMSFNWETVPGENIPNSESVLKRRAMLDAEDGGAGAKPSQQNGTQSAFGGGGAPVIPGNAPAIPGAAPSIPSVPTFPPTGWMKHPSNANGPDGTAWYFNAAQELKTEAQLRG